MNRYRNCMKIIRKFAVVQKFEWRDSRDKYELVTNVEAARDGTVSSAPRQHCVAFGNVAAPQRGGREADLCTGQGGRGRWVQPRPQKDFQVGGPWRPWILAEVPGSLKPQVPSILCIPNMEGHRNGKQDFVSWVEWYHEHIILGKQIAKECPDRFFPTTPTSHGISSPAMCGFVTPKQHGAAFCSGDRRHRPGSAADLCRGQGGSSWPERPWPQRPWFWFGIGPP